jgi:serine protease Do
MEICNRSRFCLPSVAIFLICFLTSYAFEVGAQLESPNNSPVPVEEDQDSSILTNQNLGRDLTTLFNDVDQSIVQISEARASSFGSRQGSGFIYDNLGHIITNYHVVADPGESQETSLSDKDFHITFLDGTTYIGRVIGADLYSELAVLKVENITGDSLIPLPLGNSSQVRIGQVVLAVGNPFGLSGSMTEGIVSGFGRILPSSVPQGDLLLRQDAPSLLIPNLIQTDAAINPSNSGGPLLNTAGEVIGMNTEIFSNSGEYAGVGSAIPSDIIRKVVPELISTGTYRHPYIGITGVDVSPEIATEMGLNSSRGFLVTEVTSGSPAERSGIRDGGVLKDINGRQIELGGDVIVAVDNVTVRKIEDLLSYLQSARSVGENVILRVIRDGKFLEIGMTVTPRPTQLQLETEQSQQQYPTLGINTINMTEQIAARMNLTRFPQQQLSNDVREVEREGVLVVDVFANGPADQAGIRGGFIVADINGTPVEIGGDVIMRIDNTMIANVDALDKFIGNKNIGDTIEVIVIRNAQPIKIPVIVGSTSEFEALQPGNGSYFPTQTQIDRPDDFFSDLYDRCTETLGPFVCNPLFRR